MKRLLYLLLPVLLITACGAPKQAALDRQSPEPAMEFQDLDTLFVTPDLNQDDAWATGEPEQTEIPEEIPYYNASAKQVNDLLHTQLDVRFNWEKEQVIGKATLRLKPYFYPTSTATIDAKGFTFKKVSFAGKTDTLAYTYNGQQITIQLGRTFNRNEEYTLFFDYIATPSAEGGSAAITSDKGLFFINPRGEEGDKPRQIWTQGETENNSRWFPTIDKPNERCTQALRVTVEKNLVTLSNGALVSSTTNPDGTRTDYWKHDLPHAPYLFMLAVGEFAVVRDTWKGRPVEYYVEPKYEKDARAIFPYTPEMLTFFSEKFNYEYPWAKYSQIVVRDYVSGAMENTTAVIFGEFMQRRERELIDELTNEKIVAHEMMHHWFGDLVTCESWANLTLNEGFANYSEYLWLEHKYGRDAADYHLFEEWAGYFGQARTNAHPLIDYQYGDKEDMFDAHSYNKGGAVLHMLRHYVGDEAFFAALNLYLKRHQYTAVEIDELRMAFEDVTGEDLHWFFNQWFMEKGHPKVDISYGYDSATREAIVTVAQSQDPDNAPAIFQLPIAIDVYLADTKPVRHNVLITKRTQEIRLPAATEPRLVIFDANRTLLAERKDDKTPGQLMYQFYNAPLLFDRIEAISLLDAEETTGVDRIILAGLKDPFHAIRSAALSSLTEEMKEEALPVVREMARQDKHSEVRSEAIAKLAEWQDDQAVAIAVDAISTARPYNVISAALQAVAELDPAAGASAAKKLENEESEDIATAIGSIYAASADLAYLPFFEQRLEKVDGFNALTLYTDYQKLLAYATDAQMAEGADRLSKIALNMSNSPWRRLSASKAIVELQAACTDQALSEPDLDKADLLRKRAKILSELFTQIKAAETNPEVRNIYDQF